MSRSGRVLVISGPNLNLLGEREPAIYGHVTLEDCLETARKEAERHGFSLEHVQSNSEGDLIDAIHEARGEFDAIVINAGALSHTSWAIRDGLASFEGLVIEVHLSNPAAREPFRHTSVIAAVSNGSIAGLGSIGYGLAINAIAELSGFDGKVGSL